MPRAPKAEKAKTPVKAAKPAKAAKTAKVAKTEAERGLARQTRHTFRGRRGHRVETPVEAGPVNPSDACFSPLITMSMATSLPLSAAAASALWSVSTRALSNPPSQCRSMIG